MDERVAACELLAERMHSMEELDLVLLLRSAPRVWCADELVVQTGIEAAELHALLGALVERGFVQRRADGYAYAVQDPELEAAVARVLSPDVRAELMVRIAQSALERVREDARKLFLGALRGKDPSRP